MKSQYFASKRLWFFATALGLLFVFWAFNVAGTPSCTIFTARQGETVLFGNNEDWHSPELLLGFRPATRDRYGAIYVGFKHSDGSIEFGGAMNDQGLAWDVNSVPRSRLTPHPERPYAYIADNFFGTITQQAASVEQVLGLVQKYDFGDSMALQIHIADASGDAVVISAGPDGEVAFTRKPPGDGFLVSTNFNLADPDKGSPGWRYETATGMLAELDNLTPQFAGKALEAVHLNMLTTYTMYSNIFDLKNKRVYLYYMSQYGEMVELDLAEQLALGERTVSMRRFFSPKTVAAGDAAYQRFEQRFKSAQVLAVFAGLVLVGSGVYFAIRRRGKTKDEPVGTYQPSAPKPEKI